ncbi:MAG: hypothetical protein RLZZ127_1973 [Planctomycetota bacterium]|jgi:transcriptional regulator with GAF, ATPase, and Fis domain
MDPIRADLADALAGLAAVAVTGRSAAVQDAGLAAVRTWTGAGAAAILRFRQGRCDVRAVAGLPETVRHHPVPLERLGDPAALVDGGAVAPVPTGPAAVLGEALGLPDGTTLRMVRLRIEDIPYGAVVAAGADPSADRALAAVAQVLELGLTKVRLRWRLWRQEQLLVRGPGRGDAGDDPAEAVLERSRAPDMRNAILLARQAAQADTPILITGETGVGKEVLARAVHAWSRRQDGPFVAVNCAALPAGLRESELFGHAAGAFSGAVGARSGRFQEAEGGTLLLDEVGELDPAAQAMLLRVLQEKRYEPVGSDRSRRADVRILAATNRDLEAEVAVGRFRRDLWYRLSVFPLHIPPLRDRREDISDLAAAWLGRHARRTGRGPWSLTPGALERMRAYPWPGNVRELLNSLERATILAPAGGLDADYFPALPVAGPAAVAAAPRPSSAAATLAEQEDAAIRAALVRCRGRIYGPLGAAAELGLKPSTLQSRMRKRGIPRVPPG